VTAPLAAPFKPKDADLFAVVSAFDAAYSAYADFQSNMERYWCLRWLAQQNARQVDAVVLKDEVLRLIEIPLIVRLPGMPQAARGTQVRLDLIRWDEIDLSVEARIIEIASTPTEASVTAVANDEIATSDSETDAESVQE
jgi:exoribonuclease-2